MQIGNVTQRAIPAPHPVSAPARHSTSAPIDYFVKVGPLKPLAPQDPHIADLTAQAILDNANSGHPGRVLRVCLRMMGKETVRRISNAIKTTGLNGFYSPGRDYLVLPPTAKLFRTDGTPLVVNGAEFTAAKLAEMYKPDLYSINSERVVLPDFTPGDIRYEVLPPSPPKNCYSIVYYVRCDDEAMPLPFFDGIYRRLRPILYGTKADWEAIEVDIDRDLGKPARLAYESANYQSNKDGYFTNDPDDLHVKTEVTPKMGGVWEVMRHKSTGLKEILDVADPFSDSSHAGIAFVSWNGGFDLKDNAKNLKKIKDGQPTDKPVELHKLREPPLAFLDGDLFIKEGFDLRTAWLQERKNQEYYVTVPRKELGT